MSLKFQETLIGNKQTIGSINIPYFSNITMKHADTGIYLHSHVHLIPLRHEDGRVSSQGQQVNGYAHCDKNSEWQIEPVDVNQYHWDIPELTETETERGIRYIRDNDLIRLRHLTTDSYLKTHDVASPLTQTNMEMTTIKESHPDYSTRYNETVWKIVMADGEPGSSYLKTKKELFKIVSAKYNVAVYSHKKKLLPEWGYKMQEINGNKNLEENGNTWTVQDVYHPRIVNNTDIDDPPPKNTTTYIPFMKKWAELQALMIKHNAALTQSHPYASAPITWPFVVRGISFWEKKEGFKQIYLLGNPVSWWLSILGLMVYVCMWVIDRTLLHRGMDDFGINIRRWWDRSMGFLFIAWAFHWIPFFLMGRMLFLHHYLPAFIITVMLTATLIDFFGRMSRNSATHHMKTIIPMNKWMVSQGSLFYHIFIIALTAVVVVSFIYFMPLSYGTGFPSRELLRTRKWFKSWDLQHA